MIAPPAGVRVWLVAGATDMRLIQLHSAALGASCRSPEAYKAVKKVAFVEPTSSEAVSTSQKLGSFTPDIIHLDGCLQGLWRTWRYGRRSLGCDNARTRFQLVLRGFHVVRGRHGDGARGAKLRDTRRRALRGDVEHRAGGADLAHCRPAGIRRCGGRPMAATTHHDRVDLLRFAAQLLLAAVLIRGAAPITAIVVLTALIEAVTPSSIRRAAV